MSATTRPTTLSVGAMRSTYGRPGGAVLNESDVLAGVHAGPATAPVAVVHEHRGEPGQPPQEPGDAKLEPRAVLDAERQQDQRGDHPQGEAGDGERDHRRVQRLRHQLVHGHTLPDVITLTGR